MKKLLLVFFLTAVFANLMAQDSTSVLTGKIIDKTSNPLSGVSITVKGTANSTTTDESGVFKLPVQTKSVTLEISYVGYATQEIPVRAGQTSLEVTMDPAAKDMNEVVVIGYGTMRKSDVTGAVASVNQKSLNTIPTGNPIEALQGKISGVNIGAVTSPGQTPTIRIRGNRSLNASNEPLYVVDGIPRNTIEDIPVSEIESMEVLKDAASAAIYGSRGANGVILISTKRAKLNSKTAITYNSYAGINQAKFPKLMNGEEYIKFRKDVFRANQNTGWASGEPANESVFGPRELEVVNSGEFVDWQGMMYNKNSFVQEHNLN
ncbi:MAG: carboxypeptidase-like regulatory domain-containing protein, partial [Flavitalea sp.]